MITFVTAWYTVKAKFNVDTYKQWISNLLENVNNFNLVIFTNKESVNMIIPFLKNNDKIRIIMYEWDEFSTYHLKDKWISNHNENNSLNRMVNWKLNMLWNEKINMVKIVKDSLMFATNFIGWCDIGYFRCRPILDIPESLIQQWPNHSKINELNKNKIYYCMVSQRNILSHYARIILDKNNVGLPKKPIPPDQISIAGGFFLSCIDNIDWYHKSYYDKLNLYFNNNYLIKDDQIIVLDTVISNLKNFAIIEQINGFDRWFGFQNFLL